MTIFNATQVMTELGIRKIERVAGRWLVRLDDGRCGVGSNAAEAYEYACHSDAFNAEKVA